MGVFSKTNIFEKSGPFHLTSVDWENRDHRRSVVASLVNGVYVLERDRQENRQGHQAQAPPWWNFFQFQLIRELIDDEGRSIFGAIYEYSSNTVDSNAPKYVIAFRGTLFRPDSIVKDIELNFDYWKCRLHQSPRFKSAIRAVENEVNIAGATNVWLAGHSLGSAIALLVGKHMTKEGKPMKTFLFNSPFISIPIEWIKEEKLKRAILFGGGFAKAGIGCVKKLGTQKNESTPFYELSKWFPELFLNPKDPICSGYIGYFQQRVEMERIGAIRIGRVAATQSLMCSIVSVLRWKNLEAWHLLPSANLTTNSNPDPHIIEAHGIHQWWDPNFRGQYEQPHF